MPRLSLAEVIDRLQALYGRPKPPPVTDPWLMVLWENVAYLVDDERRGQAFRMLEEKIGTRPELILAAPDRALLEITGHGIVAQQGIKKLRRCAQIAQDEFDGDLRSALKLPLREAKKALQKFPGFGEPAAERVLLFNRSHPVFSLDSNALRVLIRVGFGVETKNYSTTYRSVQAAVAGELSDDPRWRIRAHQLLRRHGQELCKRNKPLCTECPLSSDCPDYLARIGKKRI
jgi:endonuclease-3 related protein